MTLKFAVQARSTRLSSWTDSLILCTLTKPRSGPGTKLDSERADRHGAAVPGRGPRQPRVLFPACRSLSSLHGLFPECSLGAQDCPLLFLLTSLAGTPVSQIFPWLDSYLFRLSSKSPLQRPSPSSLAKSLATPTPLRPSPHLFMLVAPSTVQNHFLLTSNIPHLSFPYF